MNERPLVIAGISGMGFNRRIDDSDCSGYSRISGLWVIYSKLAQRTADMVCEADHVSDDLYRMILQVCNLHDSIRMCVSPSYRAIVCTDEEQKDPAHWDDYLGRIFVNLIRITDSQIEKEESLTEYTEKLISLVEKVSQRTELKIYGTYNGKDYAEQYRRFAEGQTLINPFETK